MHGRGSENWKRRRRHMWPVPAPGPPVVVRSSSSLYPSSDFSIQGSVDSFVKDGRKIQVGDCALFQAGNAPPFIGIIRWFTAGKEDCLKLCVNWLYRPADIKLGKGILLEAAPNEVFYSFHKDVIPAASLLHPCKVAFLRKGVELPSGISSFVCRRVYDIANKCLWWLTDQDYINERQEEVDQLLDRSRLEMQAAVQSGGRSPKSLNGSTSTQQLKSGTESVQNSGTAFPSQVKGKKRERGGDQGTEPIKRERPTKQEDGEPPSSRFEVMTKAEIAKITEKGALTTTESLEKLVHLMQIDRTEKKIDLAGKILLADVIAATDRIECLSRFVQLRGVPVLDDWLQEAHKGKTGDGSSPKDSDKGADVLLLALLRALDKLPVNLNALQTCNIGKSVNHLRSHKNLDIQKKARSLVDVWKKRVDAEMTKINDAKIGASNQAVTWAGKSGIQEVPHAGGRRPGSTEATNKTANTQASMCKTLVGKPGNTDAIVKSTPVASGSLKLPSPSHASLSINSKDSPGKGAGNSGNSDLPLSTVKEEKSSSSSQSPNNSQSCSSDHAKTGSLWKEDARSSTAGSMSASKTSGNSRHRRPGNGFSASSVFGVQKESNLTKSVSVNRNTSGDKVSSQSGLSSDRAHDMPSVEYGNSHRLIVRLPNPSRSPSRIANGGSLEDPSIAESPAAVLDEHRSADETGRGQDVSRAPCSSSGNGERVSLIEPRSRNSFSSINALVESCAKYCEASASLSAGDDIGINLLANVAAGEISKSDLASPSASPKEEPCAANDEAKCRFSCEDSVMLNHHQSDEIPDVDSSKQGKSDNKVVAPIRENKLTSINEELESRVANQSTVDDNKPGDCSDEKIAESSTKASDLVGNTLGDGYDNDIPATDRKPDRLVAEELVPSAPSVTEVSTGATFKDQPQSPIVENDSKDADRICSDPKPSSIAHKVSISEIADVGTIKKSDKVEDNSSSPSNSGRKEQTALSPRSNAQAELAAVSLETCSRVNEILNKKKAPESGGREPLPAVQTEESEKCGKPIASKSGAEPDKRGEIASLADASSALFASEPDKGAKLDFDLNEGFLGDDENQNDHLISPALVCSHAIHLPSFSPFAPVSMSNGVPAPITVAAPAKGPFVPPENLLKSKGEPGWKGSAATSAFRPAEPRKILEMPLNTSDIHSSDTSALKQGRPPLDIDLNVADEIEDGASHSSPQTTGSSNRDAPTRSSGGIDLDLNKVDESADNGHFSASTRSRSEVSLMPVKPASGGFPNGEANMLRNFDLNNGPGTDEVGAETLLKPQPSKNSNNMPFLPSLSNLRMGNMEMGNVSSWYPPGNSYPAVAIPSFFPDRVEQTYPIVAAPVSQRILGSVAGDVYRSPVLSSSPTMAFSHAPAFPYAAASFPFGTSFPLASTSFSGCPTTYVDSSLAAASCFPAISSHYTRPYMVSVPEGSSNAVKWGKQGLDLNAGPGSVDVDVKEDRLLPSASSRQLPIASSQAFLEEQARMYQASGGGIKRKEREGGPWDERFYKQPSWQ
ncbi:uncharacterized protein LOC109840359 isoform X2 [Asparagus officinalis]|uniref:uncharacterized protein LOC109840359 isoform X2 n=1 Tax=Asparagus officinalis TaxID=4686 RepID=UPI00098E266A|nr:uncharacterized protein LOC109840359 isoform X2 [Asparagus officinalis]